MNDSKHLKTPDHKFQEQEAPVFFNSLPRLLVYKLMDSESIKIVKLIIKSFLTLISMLWGEKTV